MLTTVAIRPDYHLVWNNYIAWCANHCYNSDSKAYLLKLKQSIRVLGNGWHDCLLIMQYVQGLCTNQIEPCLCLLAHGHSLKLLLSRLASPCTRWDSLRTGALFEHHLVPLEDIAAFLEWGTSVGYVTEVYTCTSFSIPFRSLPLHVLNTDLYRGPHVLSYSCFHDHHPAPRAGSMKMFKGFF